MVFRSLARRHEGHAAQIRRVVGDRANRQLTIVHDGGRIRLRMPLTDDYDFVDTLRRLNPAIDLRGV